MNTVLQMIEKRTSVRVYDPTPLTADEKHAILHAAMRAPTAGNMMLYSILEIEDQAIKDRLAETCDDQPFIAKAPWVLMFVADYQKWTDLFDAGGCAEIPGVEHPSAPGFGDMLMACSDALIAAQTAVLAAESLGIGSCYIGDILENGEVHASLLHLPPHTLPIAMLCLGRPASTRAPVPRYEKHVVHTDRYRRLPAEEAEGVLGELQAMHSPHGLPEGVANYAQHVYLRKYVSAFQREMNRASAWWLDRWRGRE